MTKIYEALMHASRQPKEWGQPTPVAHIESVPMRLPRHFDMELEMLDLYQAIESLISPDGRGSVIQFIGSLKGEGASTIAWELAKTSATRIGKKVLLLDADRLHPQHHLHAGPTPQYGWLEGMRDGRDIDEIIYQVKQTTLYISPVSSSTSTISEIFGSQSIDVFLEALKDRFDMVVIDSPPITQSPDGLAIAPKVDGSVLVVEAERTRWTVAESVKRRLSASGGNLLGVVFNKRRFYIPSFIYKLL